jgi:hypothetical protein
MSRAKRTSADAQTVFTIQTRLADFLKKRDGLETDYALASVLKVSRNRINEWFVRPAKAMGLLTLHRILKEQHLSADWLFFGGDVPERRSADRPLTALGAALRNHVIDELSRQIEGASGEEIGRLIPLENDLLQRLIHRYNQYVAASIYMAKLKAENAALRADRRTDARLGGLHAEERPIRSAYRIVATQSRDKQRVDKVSQLTDKILNPPVHLGLPAAVSLSEPLEPVPAAHRRRRQSGKKKSVGSASAKRHRTAKN